MTTLLRDPRVEHLPEAARRYLDHAIAPDALPAREVRLRMHGDIRLKVWAPFEAEETIRAGRDMRWNARTKVGGLPVSGFDEAVRGFGKSAWKLFGVLPIAFAHGEDVSRSAIGRMAAESIWLPTVLRDERVRWASDGPDEATFALELFGRTTEVSLGLSPSGRVETIAFERWGNPRGLPFGLYRFGGYVEEETCFGGFTIPSRVRLGWHFGTDRFEAEGEFFRAVIDEAEFQ
jgi:hypothetical protein